MLFAFAGSAVAFACFLPWAAKNSAFPVYFRRDLRPRLLAIGFFGSALPKATAIVLSYPVLTALFSHLFGIEKIQAYQLIGLGLALAGAYWATLLARRQEVIPLSLPVA